MNKTINNDNNRNDSNINYKGNKQKQTLPSATSKVTNSF